MTVNYVPGGQDKHQLRTCGQENGHETPQVDHVESSRGKLRSIHDRLSTSIICRLCLERL